jgi:hypothetical protein
MDRALPQPPPPASATTAARRRDRRSPDNCLTSGRRGHRGARSTRDEGATSVAPSPLCRGPFRRPGTPIGATASPTRAVAPPSSGRPLVQDETRSSRSDRRRARFRPRARVSVHISRLPALRHSNSPLRRLLGDFLATQRRAFGLLEPNRCVGRRSTEPKVSGSNPDGRASRLGSTERNPAGTRKGPERQRAGWEHRWERER